MANQVKFRALTASTYASESNKDNGTLYFLTDEGTLYKGATRFGVPKVFSTSPTSGAAKGDLLIADGAVKVYSGSTWTELKTSSQVTSDIIAGLSTASGDNKFVKSITKGDDGKFTANVQILPVYSVGAGTSAGKIKVNDSDVAITGWDTLSGSVDANATNIGTLQTKVSAIETWKSGVAESWNSDIDTKIAALSSSAGVSGSYIESIVQANGVVTAVAKPLPTYSLTTGSTSGAVEFNGSAVSVSGWSTLTGSVEANTIAINGVDARVQTLEDWKTGIAFATSISSSEGTGLVTEGQVVDYVTEKMADVVSPMNFIGVKNDLDEVTSPNSGDIVLVGTKEYVYDGNDWVELGDETILGNIQTSVQELQSGVSVLQAGLKSAESQIEGLAAQIESVDSALAGYATKDELDSTKSFLMGEINDAADTAKSYIDSKVEEVNSSISELTSDLTGYATVEALDSAAGVLQAGIDDVEGKIDAAVTTKDDITSENTNLVTAKAVYDALCWIEE